MPNGKFHPVHLSPQELQILALVADGHTDVEIGKKLSLSPKTINYHVETVKRMFDVHTRIEAVVSAMRRGILH